MLKQILKILVISMSIPILAHVQSARAVVSGLDTKCVTALVEREGGTTDGIANCTLGTKLDKGTCSSLSKSKLSNILNGYQCRYVDTSLFPSSAGTDIVCKGGVWIKPDANTWKCGYK